jgi:hypothetical protein
MQNPFESGHIKNYVLLYVSVVVIMVLFFIASTLFHDVKKVDKKTFNKQIKKSLNEASQNTEVNRLQESSSKKFKLLDKAY